MKTVVLWLFNRIGELVSTGLTWKIYGNFSLFHFIFASLFLLTLFKLFGFSIGPIGNNISFGVHAYKNAENKRDKANYYHVTQKKKYGNTTEYVKYKVNRKTGEVNKL